MLDSNGNSTEVSGVHGGQLYPSDTPSEHPVIRLNTLLRPVLLLDLHEGSLLSHGCSLLLCTFSVAPHRMRNLWGPLRVQVLPFKPRSCYVGPQNSLPKWPRAYSLKGGPRGSRLQRVWHFTLMDWSVHMCASEPLLGAGWFCGWEALLMPPYLGAEIGRIKNFTFRAGPPGQYESVFGRVGE